MSSPSPDRGADCEDPGNDGQNPVLGMSSEGFYSNEEDNNNREETLGGAPATVSDRQFDQYEVGKQSSTVFSPQAEKHYLVNTNHPNT